MQIAHAISKTSDKGGSEDKYAVLQIRRGNRDNFGIIFHIL